MAMFLRTGVGRFLPAAAIRPFALGGPASLSFPVCRAAATVPLTKPAIQDPERPKRPGTAWLRYLGHFRSENKGLGPKEIMATASTKWKALGDSEKAPFLKAFEVEQATYKQQMEQYVSSGKKDAWARDPARPKKPMVPFFRFAGEFRAKNPQLKSVTEATKGAKVAWAAVTEAEKAVYQKQFEQDNAKWKVDMESYQASGKEQAWQKKVGITAALEKLKTKEDKVKAAADAKKLKAKALSDRTKAKELDAKQKAKEVAARAKEKDAAAKEKVKAKLLAAKEAAAAKKAGKVAKEKAAAKLAKEKEVATKAKAKAKADKEKAKATASKKQTSKA